MPRSRKDRVGIQFQKKTVKQLRRILERRVFAIPELQREFVWDLRKVANLLDSIYRGYPIGSPLIWRTNRANAGQLRKSLHILPQFDTANSEIWFLLDGQQRISVLWQLLRDVGEPVSVGDRTIDFGQVYFLPGRRSDGGRFGFRKQLPHDAVRVVDLLSPRWSSRVGPLRVRERKRVEECRERLFGYPIWFSFVNAKRLQDVQETFVRINSLGTPLKGADRAFARATSVKLRHRVRELQGALRHGFGKVKDETVLQTAGHVLGSKDVGARAIQHLLQELEGETGGSRTVTRMWQALRNAFAMAADYLVQHFGVLHHKHLPSETMLSVLATFFYYNRSKRPSRAARDQIHRWFWSASVSGRYTGRGFRGHLVSDIRFMQKLAQTGSGRFKVERVPLDDLMRADYRRRSALTDAYFCLLRLQQPKYLEDGEDILLTDFSAVGNRRDRHHLFPQALLREYRVAERRIHSLANICLIVARENQSVGRRDPRDYLFDVPQDGHVRRKAARSHLIPLKGWRDEPRMKKRFDAFSRLRARMISDAFAERAGTRIFTTK